MLYGRYAEISALDEVIAQAHHGCGGAVVLRGEAGAGKTALLDAVAARGEAMRVLRTGGFESESDLAFAALHQLLWPVAGLLDALPGPQRDALRAALGQAVGGAGDRFLLGAGVLSLLVEVAGPEGLICVVDDFQWADRASADALLFAARRLGTERIAMLFAVRGDAPVKGVSSTVGVGGLPEDAAAALLESRHGRLAAPVRRELIKLTGANPLALNEIAARLTPAQLSGREPLPDPLPGGARLFGDRVTGVSAHAWLVALLAAVETDAEVVLPATERLAVGAGVLLAAIVPGVSGGPWWGSVLVAVLLAAVVLGVTPALTVRLLQQRGTGLLEAMATRDTACLHASARTKSSLTRPLDTLCHSRSGAAP